MGLLFTPSPTPYRPHLPSWRQPLYLHLRPLWTALSKSLVSCRGRVLDVGCGLQPYRSMLDPNEVEYVGVDRESPLSKPTVIGDALALPFADAHFDVVFSTQVLEHVADPGAALKEAVRVLRPGGRLILTVPGVWPSHEVPHDYWRFTRYGLKNLLDEHGVSISEIVQLGGVWATIGQMANLELQRGRLSRELVPLVNVLSAALDRLGSREDLALCWLVEGIRSR